MDDSFLLPNIFFCCFYKELRGGTERERERGIERGLGMKDECVGV